MDEKKKLLSSFDILCKQFGLNQVAKSDLKLLDTDLLYLKNSADPDEMPPYVPPKEGYSERI